MSKWCAVARQAKERQNLQATCDAFGVAVVNSRLLDLFPTCKMRRNLVRKHIAVLQGVQIAANTR